MKLSKSKSNKYWYFLLPKLEEDFDNIDLWNQAYDFFYERIFYRYLKPIELIQNNDDFSGQGFSIMTIYCSLIEFLETTYQGINFRIERKKLVDNEYGLGYSSKIFISFLSKRKPFLIKEEIAKDFYTSVRCGLLHEAKLGINWKIRVDNPKIIDFEKGYYIINRNIFGKNIQQFLILYKKNLLAKRSTKEAFIRKFNYLAEE